MATRGTDVFAHPEKKVIVHSGYTGQNTRERIRPSQSTYQEEKERTVDVQHVQRNERKGTHAQRVPQRKKEITRKTCMAGNVQGRK